MYVSDVKLLSIFSLTAQTRNRGSGEIVLFAVWPNPGGHLVTSSPLSDLASPEQVAVGRRGPLVKPVGHWQKGTVGDDDDKGISDCETPRCRDFSETYYVAWVPKQQSNSKYLICDPIR